MTSNIQNSKRKLVEDTKITILVNNKTALDITSEWEEADGEMIVNVLNTNLFTNANFKDDTVVKIQFIKDGELVYKRFKLVEDTGISELVKDIKIQKR
jgi:hypothetical protein